MTGKPTKFASGSTIKTFRLGSVDLERLGRLGDHLAKHATEDHPSKNWTDGDTIREVLRLASLSLGLEGSPAPPARAASPSPRAPAASPMARLYEAMEARADADFGLVSIPALVRALAPLSTAEVHQLLLAESAAGRIELRPEANPQDLSAADRKLSVPLRRGVIATLALDIRGV